MNYGEAKRILRLVAYGEPGGRTWDGQDKAARTILKRLALLEAERKALHRQPPKLGGEGK